MSALRTELEAALQGGASAAELEGVVTRHCDDIQAFRENDDLILLAGEGRRLMVRRVAPGRFITAETAAASGSTNLLDAGHGMERDLDGLVDEIAAFASL